MQDIVQQKIEEMLAARPNNVVGIGIAELSDEGLKTNSSGVVESGSSVPVNESTSFPLGSFTKVLTAAMVMQLMEEGKCALDDSLNRFLPSFKFKSVSLRHVLSHSGGLPDAWAFFKNGDALAQHLSHGELLARPGTVFSYSNAGYVLLGEIIQNLSGRSWYECLRERWIEPAGAFSIADSVANALNPAASHTVSPTSGDLVIGDPWPSIGDAFDPAGTRLMGNASDAARLGFAVMTGRAIGTQLQLLSSHSRAAMQTVHAQVPGMGLLGNGWGLGWSLLSGDSASVEVLGHIGGTSVLVAARPALKSVLAVLTNSPYGMQFGRDLLGGARSGALPNSWDAAVPQPLGPRFAAYEGRFRSETLDLSVEYVNDALTITNPFYEMPAKLVHQGGNAFWVDFGPIKSDVVFGPIENGRPSYVHCVLPSDTGCCGIGDRASHREVG
jgi:CubicO group peptidase (beta-lactamase class C family)